MHGGIYRCTGIYFFKSAISRNFQKRVKGPEALSKLVD